MSNRRKQQSALHFQYTILDNSPSNTVAHLCNCVLENLRVETTIYTSLLDTYLSAFWVEYITEYCDIIKQLACQAGDRGPWKCLLRYGLKFYSTANLMTKMPDSVNILCASASVVDFENTLIHGFVCPQNFV